MSRRYNHPLAKHVDLNIGQRVELMYGKGTMPFLADVVSIFTHGVGEYTVDFKTVTDGGRYGVGTSLAWKGRADEWEAGSLPGAGPVWALTITRLRGKPYVPLVDPPRAMGARKKKSATPRVVTAKPLLMPKAPPMEAQTVTIPASSTNTPTIKPVNSSAESIAAAIAGAIIETLPSRDDIASSIATGVAEEAAKMAKALDASLKETVSHELKAVKKEHSKFVEVVEAVVAGDAGKSKRAALRVAVAKTKGNNVILDKLSPFYTPGQEAPANVLLASPPSFGKSYAIRLLGETYDLFLEHGCSDDMDEIATLLGSPIPDGSGGFVVVDGVLTEAMRAASAGKNVLLLLDEVLRLTPRAQEWLLTFLTGVKVNDGSRKYRLRTRRPMPDGTLEVIECPSTNLHIVGATNLSILNPIEAFWSRWETVRVEFTVETAEATGKAILLSYGITGPVDKLAKQWAGIVKESRQRVSDGKLRFPVDFRILERAAACSPDPTAKAVAKFAGERLADNVANWHPDTGDVDASSQSAVVPWVTRLAEV